MIHVDSHYVIGKSHDVCQDYASNDASRGFISDGCSITLDKNGHKVESHTDFGARLLVRSALNNNLSGCRTAEDWYEIVLQTVASSIYHFGLSARTLCATLGGVYTVGESLVALLCGDGVIAARRKTGEWDSHEIVYPTIPFYPIYLQDKEKFIAEVGSDFVIRFKDGLGVSQSVDNPVIKSEFSTEIYDTVVVMSDGASSFTKQDEVVDRFKIYERLLDLRGMKGRFVLRNLPWILADLEKEGYSHQDDISMAALSMDADG